MSTEVKALQPSKVLAAILTVLLSTMICDAVPEQQSELLVLTHVVKALAGRTAQVVPMKVFAQVSKVVGAAVGANVGAVDGDGYPEVVGAVDGAVVGAVDGALVGAVEVDGAVVGTEVELTTA